MDKVEMLAKLNSQGDKEFTDTDVTEFVESLMTVPLEGASEVLTTLASGESFINSESHRALLIKIGTNEPLYERMVPYFTEKRAAAGAETEA
jgi:hypothetical protein